MELKRRQFEELQQGYTSVMKYIREFSQLSRYAEEDVNTEDKRKNRFLCGLNPFVRMQLRLANKQTYQQLLDASITFEDDDKNVQEDRRKRANKETKRIQASKPKPNLEFKPRNRNYGNNNNNNNNNKGSGGNKSNPRRNVICNNCGIPGHFQRECKKPVVICYGCGQKGHIKPDCPSKPPGGWPTKGGGQASGGNGQANKGGNNGKTNNGKRNRPTGKLNCAPSMRWIIRSMQ